MATMLLAACGSKEEPPSATTTPAAQRKAPQLTEAQQAAIKLTAQMVSAVKADNSPALTSVKFELQARPELNQPLKVKLVFIPLAHGTGLGATFVADRGLTIPPNQPTAQFDAIQTGAAYPYELTVVPSEKGVQYFNAIVQMQGQGDPQVQTFSVPIIVGAPAS